MNQKVVEIPGSYELRDYVIEYANTVLAGVSNELNSITKITGDKDAVIKAVETIRKYDGRSILEVAWGLNSIAKDTRDKSAVIKAAEIMGIDEIVDTITKDNYAVGSGDMIAYRLMGIVKVIGDKDAVIKAAETIGKYDRGAAAVKVAEGLGTTAEYTKDKDAVMKVAEIMRIDEIVDTVMKYTFHRYDHEEVKYEVADGLSWVAGCTLDKDVVLKAAETLRKYNDMIAGEIVCGLGNMAEYTKDKDAVMKVAEIMGLDEIVDTVEKCHDSASEVSNGLGNIAGYTNDKNTTIKAAETLRKYDDEGVWIIAEGLGKVAKYTKDKDIVTRVCESVDRIYERSPTKKDPGTAQMFAENANSILTIFSDKYEDILNYLEKRRDREGILAIKRIYNEEKKVSNAIENLKEESGKHFGVKQVPKMIKLASYLDFNYRVGQYPELSENLLDAISNAETSLRDYMGAIGIEDLDKGIKFFSWLENISISEMITGDDIVLRILKGDKIEKNGISRTYDIRNGTSIDLESLRSQIQVYADMGGLERKVKNGDLFHLKKEVNHIRYEVSKEKNLDQEVSSEIDLNLNRISEFINTNTNNSSRKYKLSVNPSDLESQMESLQNITSCLSPYGKNFEFTKAYLANPNTFFAVIKNDKEKVVGRVTMMMGKDKDGKDKIARVSKVYKIAPLNEKAIDEALIKYAKEMGAEFMENGEMTVEGLERVSDDFVKGENGKVVVKRKKDEE